MSVKLNRVFRRMQERADAIIEERLTEQLPNLIALALKHAEIHSVTGNTMNSYAVALFHDKKFVGFYIIGAVILQLATQHRQATEAIGARKRQKISSEHISRQRTAGPTYWLQPLTMRSTLKPGERQQLWEACRASLKAEGQTSLK